MDHLPNILELLFCCQRRGNKNFKKYRKSLAIRDQKREYQSALTMSGQHRLATQLMISLIRQACLDKDIHLSGTTIRYLANRGIPHSTLFRALLAHIDQGCKMHLKFYGDGKQGCHGSLLIFSDDIETIYFEIRIRNQYVDVSMKKFWLQAKNHSTGYPPLPR